VETSLFVRLYKIAAVTLVVALSQARSVPTVAQEVAIAPQAVPPTRYEEQKRDSNGGTVSIIGSQASTPYTRFAEDIQNILDEPETNGLRILPILGRGGGQNFMDILFMKGVDMGFVEQDVINYFKKKDPSCLRQLKAEFNLFLRYRILKRMCLCGQRLRRLRICAVRRSVFTKSLAPAPSLSRLFLMLAKLKSSRCMLIPILAMKC
jgi:hypothetical protein